MSKLTLDAEALYLELLRGIAALRMPTTRLVGITSGGAWLAERLQHDLELPDEAGVISSALHRDDFSQRGLLGVEGGGDAGACGIEELADGGLVLLGHVLDAGGGQRESALFAEHGDAGVIQCPLAGSGGNLGEGVLFDGFDWLLHGKAPAIAANTAQVKAKLGRRLQDPRLQDPR